MLASGLVGVVNSRIDHPKSNDGRANINAAAIEAAKASPFIGFGGMTGVIGSAAASPSAPPPRVRNAAI